MSGWMFLLVPAHPGRPGQRAVKRSCVSVCVFYVFLRFCFLPEQHIRNRFYVLSAVIISLVSHIYAHIASYMIVSLC